MQSFYRKIKKIIHEGGWTLLFKRIRSKFRLSYLDYSTPAHMMPKGLPAVHMELSMFTSSEQDVAIAKRLLVAFQKAIHDEPKYRIEKSGADTWDYVSNMYHAEFSAVLSKDDSHSLAAYLSNMHANGSTNGISGSSIEYTDLIRTPRLQKEKGVIVKDVIVSFAEALGILPFETDTPYRIARNIYEDANALIAQIEMELGIAISPPSIDGGLFKLKLLNGSYDVRDLWSLYAAWRMQHLVSQHAAIGEIGAGIGKSAFYASRFGLLNYSIFDLPIINVIQAWYLIKTLPDKKIILYGEEDDAQQSIKIMPYWEFTKGTGRYELILNEDSFPEISQEIVDGYLQKINACTRYFLSINQEFGAPCFPGASQHHLIIPDRVKANGNFKRLYRFPFWLRRGYIEELYETTPDQKL